MKLGPSDLDSRTAERIASHTVCRYETGAASRESSGTKPKIPSCQRDFESGERESEVGQHEPAAGQRESRPDQYESAPDQRSSRPDQCGSARDQRESAARQCESKPD